MKTAAALAITLIAATSANAQIGMNCETNSRGETTCRESAVSRSERMNRESMEKLQRSMADMPSATDMEAMRRRSLQKKVAKLVKAGKCDEAKAKALDSGDLDVADQVSRLCTPAPVAELY